MKFAVNLGLIAITALLANGCAYIATSGPSRGQVEKGPNDRVLPAIQLVDVNEDVTRRLLARRSNAQFSKLFEIPPHQLQPIGSGDVLTVSIWEAAPATLFGTTTTQSESGSKDLQSPS